MMVSDALLVSTRKGLFTVERNGGSWQIASVDFLGDNVTLTLSDRRDSTDYAALDHGHFGVKLHRRSGEGAWEEIAAPVYPPKPENYEEHDMWGRPLNWSTARIWALAAGAARMSQASSGVERCLAVSSALPIVARAGKWCARCGIIPNVSSGWGEERTCPAFIRFASIRAIRLAYGWQSRRAAFGSRTTQVRAGHNAERA
jgi:hypothetical protein